MKPFTYTHDEACGMCGSPHTGNSDVSQINAQKLAEEKVKACYREHIKRQDRARRALQGAA